MQGVSPLLSLIQQNTCSVACLRTLANRSNCKRLRRSQHSLSRASVIGDRRTKSRKGYQDLNRGFPEMRHGQEK